MQIPVYKFFVPLLPFPSTPFYFLPVPFSRLRMRARKRAYGPRMAPWSSSTMYRGFSVSEHTRSGPLRKIIVPTRNELSNDLTRIKLLCNTSSVIGVPKFYMIERHFPIVNWNSVTMGTTRLTISRAFVCCSNIIFLVSRLFISPWFN